MSDIPVPGTEEINIYGCVINQVLIFSSSASNHSFFAVRHLKTNRVIDVISLDHARQVAKLLDLEYVIQQCIS